MARDDDGEVSNEKVVHGNIHRDLIYIWSQAHFEIFMIEWRR
jgi:hypothetical protein